MKKLIPIILILLVVAAVFFLRGGESSSFFENYFNKMIEAGGAKDFEKFMDNFSLQYKDDYGTNYIFVKQVVKNSFEKYDKFESVIENVVASTYKDEQGNKRADVNMDVFVTGFKGGIPTELIGETGHLENIDITLQKSLGSWKIIRIVGIDEFEDY